jgi:hypothetical protein
VTQPISAPPAEVEEQVRDLDNWAAEQSQAHQVIASARVEPKVREIVVFANRYNYSHFYKLPAHVGMQNMPAMITEMMREGCKLTDIQITFETVEER